MGCLCPNRCRRHGLWNAAEWQRHADGKTTLITPVGTGYKHYVPLSEYPEYVAQGFPDHLQDNAGLYPPKNPPCLFADAGDRHPLKHYPFFRFLFWR